MAARAAWESRLTAWALLCRAAGEAGPAAAAGARLVTCVWSWGEPDGVLHAVSKHPGTVTASATASSRGGLPDGGGSRRGSA